MSKINALPNPALSSVSFKQQIILPNRQPDAVSKQPEGDKLDLSNKTQDASVPKISRTRLFFSRLKDDQIDAINKAGRLPDNAKFIGSIGGYAICNNFFNYRTGTQILPAGYEVKKNIFGFAVVVPKGSKGFFIKKDKEN